MPKVTFSNASKTIEVAAGESILDAALKENVPIMHACGGFCSCTTCHILVTSGLDHFEAPEENELERMEYLDERKSNSRLACQSKMKSGEAVVEIINLDF